MEWNEQRIEILRKLWGQGQTASQIAAILGGITRNAVIGKAHRLGLTGRPSPIKREGEAGSEPRRKAALPTRRALPSAASFPAAPRGETMPRPEMRAAPVSAPTRPASPPPPRSLHSGTKTCSWPVGDPKHADFHFCGAPSEPGRSYCAEHCAVAYHRKSEAA